jgi:uncharacterized membrane protein HdeD (DUF308 family)
MPEAANIAGEVKSHAGWSIFLGVLIVAMGVFLVAYPFVTAAATVLTLGVVLFGAGVVEFILALRFRSAGDFFLKLFSSIIYGITGFMLFTRPLMGIAVLTILVGSMLLVQGIFLGVLAFRVGAERGRGWLLLDSAITLVLSFMILGQWPASSVWAIGTLVGIAVIMRGVTRIATASVMRRVATGIEDIYRRAA